MHIHIHIHIHVHTHTPRHPYIHACMHACMHMYLSPNLHHVCSCDCVATYGLFVRIVTRVAAQIGGGANGFRSVDLSFRSQHSGLSFYISFGNPSKGNS